MRLLDNLRSAEQKSVNAVRHGMARAKEEWGDVERRIRQRMRIYPQKLLKKKNVIAARSDAEPQPDVPPQVTPELETRKPIVSVHGHDVADDEFDHHPAA
jgi:hypothetical protein